MTISTRRNYPTGDGVVVLIPADRFVVRCVPIDPANEVSEQVELAVESFTPLPLAQLYWGYLCDPVRQHALVWMACRKHFKSEETAAWQSAAAVLPVSLLLARRPPGAPALVLHHDAGYVQVAAWAEGSVMPAVFITRSASLSAEEEMTREVQRRSGTSSVDPLCRLAGTVETHVLPKGTGLEFKVRDFLVEYDWTALATADIRDRDELTAIQRSIRHGALLWRASLVAAALVVAAAGIDLALIAGGFGLSRLEAGVRDRVGTVGEIQAAHVLAHRLEELSRQRLRFMEMLDVLNERRPAGLLFLHVTSRGPRELEVVARTQNADDARQFETALRGAPELSLITMGNLSTRDGHTDFTLRAEFRAEAFTTDLGMP